MAAPALALPSGVDRVSPFRLNTLIKKIHCLTRTERAILGCMVDLGYQGVYKDKQRDLADALGVESLRWVRKLIHDAMGKLETLGVELEVWRAPKGGVPNVYVLTEKMLFAAAYPGREYVPRKPKQPGLFQKSSKPAPPPVQRDTGPKHNPLTRFVASTMHLPKDAPPLAVVEAWQSSWLMRWNARQGKLSPAEEARRRADRRARLESYLGDAGVTLSDDELNRRYAVYQVAIGERLSHREAVARAKAPPGAA